MVNFCDQDFKEHALNYSQYIVPDTNKHFRFELDRKLNPWLKFEPNSIFSDRNQMSLFSRKAHEKLITMTGIKGGVPVLIGEL